MPDGHNANSLVASHRIIMAAVPYSIGQPTSAAVVAGCVNMRTGYIDWRAARSPSSPNVNTARKYVNVAVIGPITTNAKLSGLSRLMGSPRATTTNLIVARTNR